MSLVEDQLVEIIVADYKAFPLCRSTFYELHIKNSRCRTRLTWFVPRHSLISHVTLNKLLNLPGPQAPHLQSGNNASLEGSKKQNISVSQSVKAVLSKGVSSTKMKDPGVFL